MRRGPITEEGKKKAKANLIPFVKGDPRVNRSGAPRLLENRLKLDGYNKNQIKNTHNILLSLTIDQLKVIEADVTATILERTVARALLKGFEKGSLYNAETSTTRANGSPDQSIEANVGGKVEIVFEKGKTIL
jgi:hypothetical protein